MKKIITVLILIAGVGALVYQSTQNAKLVKADREQARVLLAELGGGGDTGGVGTRIPSVSDSSGSTITSTRQKAGCRNLLACNYDSTATTDGGTCEYAFWSVVRSTSGEGLFPDKFMLNSNTEIPFFKESVFVDINRSIEESDDSVKIMPKQGVCTKNDCVNLSIVRMSGLASTFPNPDFGSFNSSVESKGFVSARVAEFATGMKACDQIKNKTNPKTPPNNSKLKR